MGGVGNDFAARAVGVWDILCLGGRFCCFGVRISCGGFVFRSLGFGVALHANIGGFTDFTLFFRAGESADCGGVFILITNALRRGFGGFVGGGQAVGGN